MSMRIKASFVARASSALIVLRLSLRYGLATFLREPFRVEPHRAHTEVRRPGDRPARRILTFCATRLLWRLTFRTMSRRLSRKVIFSSQLSIDALLCALNFVACRPEF